MPRVVHRAGIRPSVIRHPKPDLEVRRLLLQLSPVRLGNMSRATVNGVRRQWQLCVKAFASRDRVASVGQADIDCGDRRIPLRIYRSGAGTDPRPLLLWFHGGGFVFGDLYTAGATCRALARRSGAIVVAVDYRLLPEHSFEDARSDCLAALRWAADHAASIGGDPALIAVGGDSAGGTLAALAMLDSVRLGQRIVMMQLLVYPACDLARRHMQSPDAIAVLTPEHLSWLRARIAAVSDLDDPALSPLRHDADADLPMTVLVTAGFDPLRDEALEYAHKLAKSGVPVQVLHYPGQFHGFLSFDRVLAGGRDALDRLGLALRRGFESRTLNAGTESISIPALHSLRKVLLGLHPMQRLRETGVAYLVLKEALERRFEGNS